MSAFTVAVNDVGSLRPSRRIVRKPASVNVTVYSPGRRSTMLYWPAPSVIALRAPSMSAGLATSTVTPGSTPPDESLTRPAMVLCAKEAAAVKDGKKLTRISRRSARMRSLRK